MKTFDLTMNSLGDETTISLGATIMAEDENRAKLIFNEWLAREQVKGGPEGVIELIGWPLRIYIRLPRAEHLEITEIV